MFSVGAYRESERLRPDKDAPEKMTALLETPYHPDDALGPDLVYDEQVNVAGRLTAQDLRTFARTRRKSAGMGPSVVFYAGVTSPAISAGVAAMTHQGLAPVISDDAVLSLITVLLAAVTGICWYLVFMRNSTRQSIGRDEELGDETQVRISGRGVSVDRGHVRFLIDWTAVEDVTISRNYIALIIKGANDLLMPLEWFGGSDNMQRAAKKILALRPPPFAA